VTTADMRGPAAVVDGTTAAGCAFDFEFDVDVGFLLAQRAFSVGVASTPLISAR